jgi:hypothetical protein
MNDQVNLFAIPSGLTNIEEEFCILIQEIPQRDEEIRELIIKAWLRGFLPEEACQRLLGELNKTLAR